MSNPVNGSLQQRVANSSGLFPTLLNGTVYSDQEYAVGARTSFDNLGPSTPSNSTVSSGKGYGDARLCPDSVNLSTPPGGTISSGRRYEAAWPFSGNVGLSTSSSDTISPGQEYEVVYPSSSDNINIDPSTHTDYNISFGQGRMEDWSRSGNVGLSMSPNGTIFSGQRYESVRPSLDDINLGPLIHTSCNLSSGQGRAEDWPRSGNMGLSMSSNGAIFSGQRYEGVWLPPDDINLDQLTHTDYNTYSGQGCMEDWSYPSDAGLLTPLDYTSSSSRRYAPALPYPNSVDTSTPTEGSISTGTESWRNLEDANMSSPTDGNCTGYGDIAKFYANQDKDCLNAGTALLSQNLESWTSEQGPWNWSGGPSRAPLQMLREPTTPSASILFHDGQCLTNPPHVESLPEYTVLQHVDYHRPGKITGVSEVGWRVSRAGPLATLYDLSQHRYPFPLHIRPLDNVELSASCEESPSQEDLTQASTFHLTPLYEPDNPMASNVMRDHPPPHIAEVPTQSGPSPNGTMPEEQDKKRPGRIGPMKPQQRMDAKEVRKRGACFPCRELKQKCDPLPGDRCRPCRDRMNNQKVSRWFISCDFTTMSERWAVMLPSYITGHFQDREMNEYLARAGIQLLGNAVRVKWTWGYGPPLVMKMEEISTAFRRSSSFRVGAAEDLHEHVQGKSVPLLIGESEAKKIRGRVEHHILGLVRRSLKGFPKFYHSENGGSKFQYGLLEVICGFHRSSFGQVLNPFYTSIRFDSIF
ncbi:hypothetical protein GP486_007287 [Trichoglossum hirsutum]|uniref:Zn(2)-C6 fungal-type domain-containing protein n=1 Tax=Trichoglossum hirsutum TaxID=265104 RepID=A0A9P8IIC3_9PEZI|nr:hypothetical protein GP486_007287 [Trichoglossum hirsutum]